MNGWRMADEVCVLAAPQAAGTAATHIVCDVERAVPRPGTLTLAQCAALLQPGASAWAVVHTARLQADMRVLVHGGSGAVGALELQHARALGVHTIATCHHEYRAHTLAQGADGVIAYDRESFDHLRELDAVLDFVGGDTHARSYQLLRPGSALVYLLAEPFTDRSELHGVRLLRADVSHTREVLCAVRHMAHTGVYRNPISRSKPLQDAASAHTELESGRVRCGRITFDYD